MPRRKIKLDEGEAHDSDGIVHIAKRVDPRGFYYVAACDGRQAGRNTIPLKGYCPRCFPEREQPITPEAMPAADKPELIIEEIMVNSWELPKIPRKPKIDKPIDEILRKPHMTFNRRELKPTLQDHWDNLTKKSR
jgi:hypothetical protein